MIGDLSLLNERQAAQIEPHLPQAHGVPPADDRRVVSGIVYVIKHGLQWGRMHQKLTAPKKRSITVSGAGPRPERIMIHATHLKAPRTAASLLQKGMVPIVSGEPKAD